MNLVDLVLGVLGIVMIVRLVQLLTNASRRRSMLRLGQEVLVVPIALILVTAYFFSRIIGRI